MGEALSRIGLSSADLRRKKKRLSNIPVNEETDDKRTHSGEVTVRRKQQGVVESYEK
jgi:hypothetical protein